MVDIADAIWALNITFGSDRLLFRGLTADFGDLDDSTFPTKQQTPNTLPGRSGPFHFIVNHEWIGTTSVSTTDRENDAKVIDLDSDDGNIKIYTVSSCGSGCTFGMVSVSVSADADTEIRYLNVAADFNQDGRFGMYPVGNKFQHEWLLINLPVMISSTQKNVGSSFRIVDQTALNLKPCIRATLSTELIDPAIFGISGWDGSGPGTGFLRGETEDHCPPDPGVPFPSQQVNTSAGIWFPVWPPEEIPPVPWPTPKGPFIDRPGGPIVPLEPPDTQKDVESYPPLLPEEEDASKPFAEPPPVSELPVFIYNARTPEPGVPDNKQIDTNDCAPTAAANSIEYLLKKAGVSTTGLGHEKLKEIMSPEPDPDEQPPPKKTGMMDMENGTGTSIDGFKNGKKLASDALNDTGKGIETGTTILPSFMNIYNAVNAGKDVEIAIAYEGSSPPSGHMVVVTGATLDQNGNMTLTFVDPGNPVAGEQTYTITNGAPAGTSEATGNGGLRVNNYPLSNGKPAVIRHLIEEELVDR